MRISLTPSLCTIALVALPAVAGAQATQTAPINVVPTVVTAVKPDTTDNQAPYSLVDLYRIREVTADGSFVTLVDGTLWEVYLPDRPSTDEWRAGDLVQLHQRPAGVGAYFFTLYNGRSDSYATVKFRGSLDRPE
jgi:hypothetical protein